ncbi:hypothetical protein [Caulobacter sp. FWC26]|uniref:hypothetical protein n=1 Tax=Caulobacter sp. FWC26 TaxID=69665 RepID=UPI000FDAD5A4|nr:hypothetical protein [Caulobacter sp. FWC26]
MTTFTALAPYAVFRDTTRASIRPTATVARADREFEDLRRDAPDLGVNGVHPTAVKALIGVYAALLLTFWAFFGGPETALTLGIITVLGVMFFGLLGGGILLSDSIPKGERGRDLGIPERPSLHRHGLDLGA